MVRFLAVTLVILQSCCSLALASNSLDNKDQMAKEILEDWTPSQGPGFQYIVVDRTSTIFEHSTGLSDIEGNKPLGLQDTLAAFSMTKPLTAIAILQLVEQGKLSLDDRLLNFFQHPYASEVSIRQLLAHTSGIPNPVPLRWVHFPDDHSAYDEAVALAAVLEKNNKSSAKPGTSYNYSNIGYWLLGKAIEKVSGVPYAQFIQDNIFSPLDLTPADLGFLIADEGKHAKGYVKKWSVMDIAGRFLLDGEVYGSREGKWLHIENLYANGPSFGGAIGTAQSFSVVLQDLLSEQSRLLGPSGRQLLYSQQMVASGETIAMTLGWHIRTMDTIPYFYKEGGGAGYCGEMRIYPGVGIASVLMTNRTSFNFKKHLSSLDRLFIQD